jgi:YD repeat-containing protein
MDNWTNNITGVLKAYDRNSWSYNHYGEILVGGLRIEQVKIYDEVTSTPVTTTYSYKDDEENEKGVLFSVPQYIGQIWNKSLSESGLRLGSSTATNNGGFFDAQLGLYSGLPIDYSFSAGSIHPLSTSQGSHIGYSRVKVIQPDGGYSVYNFNTVGENPEQLEAIKVIDKAQKDWDHKKNFPPAPEPLKPNRGELHRVQIYTADSKLLQEKIFKNTYVFNPEGVHGLIVHLMMNNAYGLLTEYMIQQSKKTFQSVTLLNYDVANQAAAPVGTITETFYDSPNHNQPTKESVFEVASWNPSTQVAGKGKILQQQRTTAIADVTIPWCNPLYDAFAVSSVNEAARYNQFKNSGLTSAVAINDDWRNYQYDITQIRKVYVAARKHYNIYHGRNCEISEGTYSSVSTELKAILDMKKIFKVTSPVEVSTWRDGLFLGSSWVTYKMFDNDRKSIGPGEQKLIQTPVPVSPTSTSAFVPMATSNEAITRDSRYKTEASYKFKNGAVSEVVEKNGVRTSYLWDNINNVPIAKIMNASDNQIFYTSFETDGSLTTARSGRRYFPSGMYTIPFTPPSGNTVYKMSYWYWESNTWKYSGELPFSPNIARGNGLDEIRVYPVGGVMQTYTYDIGKGMTSQTDHNGISTFFEYDDLGRLILQRDNDRKITQTYQYIYKTSAQ